jgi:hypothetical protein
VPAFSATAAGSCRGSTGRRFAMMDLIVIVLGLVLFGATIAYARAAEWL